MKVRFIQNYRHWTRGQVAEINDGVVEELKRFGCVVPVDDEPVIEKRGPGRPRKVPMP